MKKLFLIFAMLPIFGAWATTPNDEPVESATNFSATVVSVTSTNPTTVVPACANRVSLIIYSQSTNALCLELGSTCKSNAVLTAVGASFSILPPIKYNGPVSLRNCTAATNDTVTVIETWRSNP